MRKEISLGLMEQSIMRREKITAEDEAEIKNLLNEITHLEVKYLETIPLVIERIKKIAGEKRILLHAQYPTEGAGILNLVEPKFKERLGERFLEIMEFLDPDWFSVHLGFACEELKSGGQFGFEMGLSEPLEEEEVKKRIKDNVEFMKNKFLRRGEILLENLDYMPREISGGSYEHVCKPEFIKDVLNKTDCNMLLDFGHAMVSAINMNYRKPEEYIEKLPLEKVVEIHMSGCGVKDGIAKDVHHPITKLGQKEAEYLEMFLKSGRFKNLKAITLETFEDVIPQLRLLKDILMRTGYEIK